MLSAITNSCTRQDVFAPSVCLLKSFSNLLKSFSYLHLVSTRFINKRFIQMLCIYNCLLPFFILQFGHSNFTRAFLGYGFLDRFFQPFSYRCNWWITCYTQSLFLQMFFQMFYAILLLINISLNIIIHFIGLFHFILMISFFLGFYSLFLYFPYTSLLVFFSSEQNMFIVTFTKDWFTFFLDVIIYFIFIAKLLSQ